MSKDPKRWPWAAALALVLVLGFDLLLLPRVVPWQRLVAMKGGSGAWRVSGIAEDQLTFERLAEPDRQRGDVVVLGSSRARHGFDRSVADEIDPERVYSRIAHAGIGPYELLAFSHELSRYDVDWVVLPLSEFDLYRPLNPRSFTGAGSAPAAAFLAGQLEPEELLLHRTEVLRLFAAGFSTSYRFKRTLQQVWFDELRRFPSEAGTEPSRLGGEEGSLIGGGPRYVRPYELRRLRQRLAERRPDLPKRLVANQTEQLASVTAGRHAEIGRALVTKAVEDLASRGVAVLLVETPTHPIAESLRDPALKWAFRSLAESLAANPRVSFLPHSAHGRFRTRNFSDLTHLEPGSAARFTRVIVDWIRELEAESVEPNR